MCTTGAIDAASKKGRSGAGTGLSSKPTTTTRSQYSSPAASRPRVSVVRSTVRPRRAAQNASNARYSPKRTAQNARASSAHGAATLTTQRSPVRDAAPAGSELGPGVHGAGGELVELDGVHVRVNAAVLSPVGDVGGDSSGRSPPAPSLEHEEAGLTLLLWAVSAAAQDITVEGGA